MDELSLGIVVSKFIIEAFKIEVEGRMKAENELRLSNNEALVYNYKSFSDISEKIKEMVKIIAKEDLKQKNTDFICHCGKVMKFWDGHVAGPHGVDIENCEDPQYKCKCGNKVYLSEKE